MGLLQLRPFKAKDQAEAKRIILRGLEERFGFLDETLNPDVDDIYEHFVKNGDDFIVGTLDGKTVATGGLIKEETGIGRIVRVSVLKEYRRGGLASLVMEQLESIAKSKGYHELVLETNEDWDSAIRIYQKRGYKEIDRDKGQIHMVKKVV